MKVSRVAWYYEGKVLRSLMIHAKDDWGCVEERSPGRDERRDWRVCRSVEKKHLPMASTWRFIS